MPLRATVLVGNPKPASRTAELALRLGEAAGELGGALEGAVAVPAMVGAGPDHALAVELQLRPLLVELGASCPTPGLYVTEEEVQDPAPLAAWSERSAAALGRALG